MTPEKWKTPLVLSVIIVVLAAIASAGGLFVENLYRDNNLIRAAWRGNDAVTLFVVIPAMITALIFLSYGSQKASIIWLGALGYMLYNYIFYLYGAAFNPLFLIYAALFSLSVYALILALMHTDVEAISRLFNERTPVKRIGGFMLLFAVPWSVLEISRALQFVFTGQLPADIVATGHPTGVVYATDLSLLMPAMILGGILLWKRRAWGYMLAAIILFKGATYGLALITMSVFAVKATGKGDPLTPLYIFLTVGSLVSLIFLLSHLKAKDKSRGNVQASFGGTFINQ